MIDVLLKNALYEALGIQTLDKVNRLARKRQIIIEDLRDTKTDSEKIYLLD